MTIAKDDPLRDRIHGLRNNLAAIAERVRSSPIPGHQAGDDAGRESYAITRDELDEIETIVGELRAIPASDEWNGITRLHRDSHITATDRRAYREKLRVFVEHLDELLSLTGPNGPPDFADALASGDPDIGDEAYAIWMALLEAMLTVPREMPPNDVDSVDDWSGPAGLWLKALPRISRCMNLMIDLRRRWRVPVTPDSQTNISCVGGRYRIEGEDWQPITPCDMGENEHRLLTRNRNILELLSRDRDEGDGVADPPGTDSRAANQEADSSRPTLELGRPGDRPLIDGEPVPKLTDQMRNVVEALYDAGPNGLGSAELIARSGEDHAVDILRNLHKRRGEWKRLIDLPGVPHGKYRLKIAWP